MAELIAGMLLVPVKLMLEKESVVENEGNEDVRLMPLLVRVTLDECMVARPSPVAPTMVNAGEKL